MEATAESDSTVLCTFEGCKLLGKQEPFRYSGSSRLDISLLQQSRDKICNVTLISIWQNNCSSKKSTSCSYCSSKNNSTQRTIHSRYMLCIYVNVYYKLLKR